MPEFVQIATQLIGSLGFPIVACGALFWKVHSQDKMHREEMSELAKTVQNNTDAINNLLIHLKEK